MTLYPMEVMDFIFWEWLHKKIIVTIRLRITSIEHYNWIPPYGLLTKSWENWVKTYYQAEYLLTLKWKIIKYQTKSHLRYHQLQHWQSAQQKSKHNLKLTRLLALHRFYVEKTPYIQINHPFQVPFLSIIDLMALLKKLAEGNYNLIMYNCL